jgi:hypothetical protein
VTIGASDPEHRRSSNLRLERGTPDPRHSFRPPRQPVACKLLIIDQLGYVPLSPTGAELLFEVFSQRYQRGSVIVASNLPFDEWTSVFGSERLTGALLDLTSPITSTSSR